MNVEPRTKNSECKQQQPALAHTRSISNINKPIQLIDIKDTQHSQALTTPSGIWKRMCFVIDNGLECASVTGISNPFPCATIFRNENDNLFKFSKLCSSPPAQKLNTTDYCGCLGKKCAVKICGDHIFGA